MNAEQRILRWLERADFDGTGCRHSQDTIAKAVGCTREHTNRCLRKLAADGRIRVEKERRPGLKWPCNVYHLPAWNPNKRVGVLNVLASIRDARRTQCHTEGTATTREGAYAPSTSPSANPFTRCQHAARASDARRNCMCDCQDCAERLEKVTVELSGALNTVRKLGAENVRLRGGAPHSGPMDPKTANVWMIVENWMWLCRGRRRNDGKPRPLKIDPGSRRWTIAQAALNREPEGLVACIEAVEGLACKPYVVNKQRVASGRPSERMDDIQYALGDDEKVERCRRYRAQVLGANEAALWHAYQAANASSDLYGVLWSGAYAKARFSALPDYKQVAHRMRVAELADQEPAETRARVVDLASRRRVA